jgi:hypothetical protein
MAAAAEPSFFVMVGVFEMVIFVWWLMAKCACSSQIQTSVVCNKIFRSPKVI